VAVGSGLWIGVIRAIITRGEGGFANAAADDEEQSHTDWSLLLPGTQVKAALQELRVSRGTGALLFEGYRGLLYRARGSSGRQKAAEDKRHLPTGHCCCPAQTSGLNCRSCG
jgi:hypothetical protein